MDEGQFVKQLYDDFCKLGMGAIFIAIFVIGPLLIAVAPVALVLCGIFVILLPILLVIKALCQAMAKRSENLGQDPRFRR